MATVMLFVTVASEFFARIMTMKSISEVWNFINKEYEGDERVKGRQSKSILIDHSILLIM